MAENARATSFSFHAQLNTPSSALAFHIFCSFPNPTISRHFNAALSTLICCLFYFIQIQFLTPFDRTTSFIIPVLIAFLQLKYQGNNDIKSPFSTHPTTMNVAVSSSVTYCFAYIALLRFPQRRRFAAVAHRCVVWSGYATVASLASVLFPSSFTPFVYAFFAVLLAAELLYWLHGKFVDRSRRFRAQRRGVIQRFLIDNMWNSSQQRPQMLPI